MCLSQSTTAGLLWTVTDIDLMFGFCCMVVAFTLWQAGDPSRVYPVSHSIVAGRGYHTIDFLSPHFINFFLYSIAVLKHLQIKLNGNKFGINLQLTYWLPNLGYRVQFPNMHQTPAPSRNTLQHMTEGGKSQSTLL